MATESPIQIIKASGKWGSTKMEIEDLKLVSTGQRFQGRKSNLPPDRTGSAPPSIEGSFASIENLMFWQNLAIESEEQLRADPSYFEYYWAHINLNPRLPPPLISGENRNLFRNVRGSGSNRRSLWLDHGNLSTHREESDDDRSPKQDDLPPAHSPFIQEPNEEAGNHHESSPPTTSVSVSSSIEGISGNLVIKPPMNTSLNTSSMTGVADADVHSITNRMVSLNISDFPKLQNEIHETDWQPRISFPVHVAPHPTIVSLPQTYVGMNQFPHNPTNFPGYMTSEAQIYPSMMPGGYLPQPYPIGGYAFNPQPVSPYATGYLSNNPFPMPFDIMVQSFGGQCQTSGVNLQHLNTSYGHLGLPFSGEEHRLQSLGGVGHTNLNSIRAGTTNPYYFRRLTDMDFLQFPNSPFASPLMLGHPIGEAGGRNERVNDGLKGNNSNYVINDPKTSLLLEELRSGKGRRLELSDIYGHVVEFSVDQYGSRFIQQKLEVCSSEEKESIFKEVLPNAWKLMTDAFGNYVVQKFLEYGMAEQKRELGNRLEGQILPLSLHMYGCRVIQKAVEVFELEQKIKIVHELDGHVLKCVRDQNGNHVIQKCIECMPPENIKTVISSFRGQVATLAKHPYGCRVMQTVLEHSTGELHSQFIVDGILDSVSDLAQDQYGNYVIQYVLEAGKPEERSQIVHKLAGHIVQLSQHKFASNVIEKCLEYGDEAARKIIIEEIIGYTDHNDNLLVMVKDRFANYVVQKVLQTCRGLQREVLLSRIKVHLNSLKKYTYGKHIVARFEQLYGEGTYIHTYPGMNLL